MCVLFNWLCFSDLYLIVLPYGYVVTIIYTNIVVTAPDVKFVESSEAILF